MERTKEGLVHARSQGRVEGRPTKLSTHQQKAALSSLQAGMSQQEVAETFGASRSIISRLRRENMHKEASETAPQD